MCGIAALAADPGQRFHHDDLEEMLACLHHRGPDATGTHTWTEPHERVSSHCFVVGLAHTRLSILDLTHDSDQPMTLSEGDVALTFNGEIYNYVELREELHREGHTFTTAGDTEVLLKAYLHWGVGCLQRLVGMYAFVIHDARSRTVVAARDPFGIKPLYVVRTPVGTAFASELKALRRLGGVGRSVDPAVLLRYLRFGIAQHRQQSIYSDIREVEAGGYVTLDLTTGARVDRRHYDVRVDPIPTTALSATEAAGEFRTRFQRSVVLHSRSDVAVGTALSGGLDSSSIVCAVREHVGPGAALHAFTYAATDSPVNEIEWSRLAAERAGATLHVASPDAADVVAELDELVGAWDEPVAGVTVYAQYRVFRMAHEQGLKVLLDGQGADEILGGYDRYLAARVASHVRNHRWREAAALLGTAPRRALSRSRTAVEAMDYLSSESVQGLLRPLVGRSLVPRWVDARWFADKGARLPPVHHTKARDVLRDQLVSDLTENSVPNLLRYEDRNSMAWSVESRVPFLVPDLAEFCLSLPEGYLVDTSGTSKAVLRHAMRGTVPDAILDRRDKIGFEAPSSSWFRALGEERQLALLREAADALPFLKAGHVQQLWDAAGDDRRAGETAWRLIFLTRWAIQKSVEL